MGRIVTFTRKRQLHGGGSPLYIYIDDQCRAKLENGQSVSIDLDSSRHTLSACAQMSETFWSGKYLLEQGNANWDFLVYTKSRLFTVDVIIEEM